MSTHEHDHALNLLDFLESRHLANEAEREAHRAAYEAKRPPKAIDRGSMYEEGCTADEREGQHQHRDAPAHAAIYGRLPVTARR
jgi:hypothetical protein